MLEEFKNAFGKPNNAHIQLILINVVLFVALAILYVITAIGGMDGVFSVVYRHFSLTPVLHEFLYRPHTLITYAFSHSLKDIWHILFNMISLYWFGKLFIEYLGNDRLIAVYILGALAGGLLYLGLFNAVPFFQQRAGIGMVGASAAIYAIMVACATLIPDYTFFLLFFGPVRIKYIALFFILLSFLGTVSANAGGNLAHLGGAAMGYIYIRQLQSGRNIGGWITALLAWIKNLFSGRRSPKWTYHKKESPVSRGASPVEVSQEEIDAILDKISDRGYESLSKEEKEKLFRAGRK
jgi:membrane associated rhomboid family serine protease